MPLFSDGFRPFFLAASGFAVFHVIAWVAFLTGSGQGAVGWSPLVWHGHEMVFGFAAALIAGFLLTAVGNWTGRLVAGPRLIAGLAVLWLVPRIGLVWPVLPMPVVEVLAAAFFPALTLVVAVPILATRNRRNYPVLAILTALSLAGVAVHLWPSVAFLRAAIDVVMILLVFIGARVIPFFTGRGLPTLGVKDNAQLGHVSVAAVIAAVIAGWLAPTAAWPGWVAVAAALLLAARMTYWKPWGTLGVPLLWILHVGYLWIVIALALRATPFPPAATLHALTMGALGSLAIGMMTRVALGHSGRPLRADGWMVTAFVLIATAVVPRLIYPLLPFNAGRLALVVAAALWVAGFLVYFVRFVPVMFTRRRATS
ncbi:MAG: NnrS family protein [Gammaproteobacteria bacterium]